MYIYTAILFHCRGGTESTRYAVQLINALIQDPAKELEDLIPKNHIRTPSTNTKSVSSNSNSASGANVTSPFNKMSYPLGTTSITTSQSAALSTFQSVNRLNKNASTSVRSPFPVSLPLAYSHPHFALLAAQTMQQIRHPRLPMAQFGGSFPPTSSTWGPFPVRPVSPGSTNSSPKHNGTVRPIVQNSSLVQPESSGSPSTNCSITVSSVPAVSQPLSVTHSHSPSTVRKQLFACIPKTSTMASVTTSVTSTCSTLPSSSSVSRNSTQPLFSSSTVHNMHSSQNKNASFVLPKEVIIPDQQTGNRCMHSTVPVSLGISASSPARVVESRSATTTPLPNNAQEENPSLSTTFVANSESVTADTSSARQIVLPPGPENQDHCNLPQLPAPAPQVSHRMQPRGSFYSMVPNVNLPLDNQSVFVTNPGSLTPQDSLKQGPPNTVPLSSLMNIMNGSQIHINSSSKTLPSTFGPAALFNHFSSLFENQVPVSQNWGGCPLSSRSGADQPFNMHSPYLNNTMLGHLENAHYSDGSKAPGFKQPSQRLPSSPIGKQLKTRLQQKVWFIKLVFSWSGSKFNT